MSNQNFTPFPKLTTERLTLRRLELSDDNVLFKLRSDNEVNKYLVRPIPKDNEEVRALISKINNGINNKEWFYWVITLKENPVLIGTICLWNFAADKTTAELGYELFPDFHGKGIMSEALKKIIQFGFNEVELNALEAYTHKKNQSSTKLLQKYNFVLETERKDKENSDNIIFKLTKQAWMDLNSDRVNE